MKIKLNTNLVPLFRGTYESPFWEITEYNEEGTEEVEVEYKFEDLMKSIAQAYHEQEKYILSELNAPFIKSLKFLGTWYSPREYNFKTDELDFEIKVNKAELMKTLDTLKGNEDFSKFLHDNYTSYDGFWSFTPNHYQELYTEIDEELKYFEQSVAALITYLAKDNLMPHGGVSIEEMVWDHWQGNGYGGLQYTIASLT